MTIVVTAGIVNTMTSSDKERATTSLHVLLWPAGASGRRCYFTGTYGSYSPGSRDWLDCGEPAAADFTSVNVLLTTSHNR